MVVNITRTKDNGITVISIILVLFKLLSAGVGSSGLFGSGLGISGFSGSGVITSFILNSIT